jgi:hypothetical protein
MSKRKVTPEIYERMKELQIKGYKNTEISKMLNEELVRDNITISAATVRAYLVFGSSSEMDEYYARERGFACYKDYNEDVARKRAIKIDAWIDGLNR